MSNYASSCIQTLDYLLRKHDKLVSAALRLPDTLKTADTRDGACWKPLTFEEHDRIFAICRTTKMSDRAVGKMVGRSFSTVCKVRQRKHTLYDAGRCEGLYQAS